MCVRTVHKMLNDEWLMVFAPRSPGVLHVRNVSGVCVCEINVLYVYVVFHVDG